MYLSTNMSIAFPLFYSLYSVFQGASKPAPEHLATKEMFDPTTFVPREKALSCAVLSCAVSGAVSGAFHQDGQKANHAEDQPDFI